MKISIIHPSRSRASQAKATINHWLSNLSGLHEVEYILSIDSDDPQQEEYLNAACDLIVVSNNKNLVQASNAGAKESKGDIIVLVSDDFQCFKNWDIAIVKALQGKSGVLKTFDGVQKWIVTLVIMTRDYYDSQGYIYHPSMEHLFADTYLTHKADVEKKLIIRNDIVFNHNHYSVKGGTKKDSVNVKADSTWANGEKAYMNLITEFGTSMMNLSKEAHQAGHVNWLKKILHVK